MLSAAEQTSPAMPTLLVVVLIGSTLVTFGYLRAVMDRANADYKKSKGLRKEFWAAWWRAVRTGFWVAVAGVLLVAWVVHDVRQADAEPRPATSAGVK